MKSFYNLLILIILACFAACTGKSGDSTQEAVYDPTKDSTAVAKSFTELVGVCKNVSFSDPKVLELGTFYQAAPYIVYRGSDTTRNWKDLANYNNEAEREGVDNVCLRINGTINQSSAYKIERFLTDDESEGRWYVLDVSYFRRGTQRVNSYAFLKIGDKFALGDID